MINIPNALCNTMPPVLASTWFAPNEHNALDCSNWTSRPMPGKKPGNIIRFRIIHRD